MKVLRILWMFAHFIVLCWLQTLMPRKLFILKRLEMHHHNCFSWSSILQWWLYPALGTAWYWEWGCGVYLINQAQFYFTHTHAQKCTAILLPIVLLNLHSHFQISLSLLPHREFELNPFSSFALVGYRIHCDFTVLPVFVGSPVFWVIILAIKKK